MPATDQAPGAALGRSPAELLLRVVVMPPRDALEAWRAFRAESNLDDAAWTSYELLPQVYRSLRALGVADPDLPRLKGTYRRTWAANQVVLREVGPLLQCLREAGVRAMLLGTAALAVTTYPDPGLRGVTAVRVLAPPGEAATAVDALKHTRWAPLDEARFRPTSPRGEVRLPGPGRAPWWLHWRPLAHCGDAAAEVFWAQAELVRVKQAVAWVPAPTEQLLYVCALAEMWGDDPRPVWLADAACLVRRHVARLDWHRLFDNAQRLGLSWPVRHTLLTLHHELSVALPGEVLERAAALPVSAGEARYFALATRPMGALGRHSWRWHHYRRLAAADAQRPTLLGFVRYLQDAWNLNHAWETPVFASRRTLELLALARRRAR